jgi:cyclopropane fatty-acyl-phospholipid synthase-like methyltransferase
MDWVKEFYTKQNEWAGVYSGEITDYHKRKVETVKQLCGMPPKNILELGAGGGQFADTAANFGYHITAIELVSSAIQNIEKLSQGSTKDKLKIIHGDFYEIQLEDRFNIICYWDGFGIGSDEDQKSLLKRIYNWLEPDGCALIDIYTPWYWSKVAGHHMKFNSIERQYDFEYKECRMLDHWWCSNDKHQIVTQSLRCYSPADLNLILRDTGLKIETIESGGSLDYDTMKYSETVPLREAMTYLVKLVKDT